MVKEIKIGTQAVTLEANAATPIRYRNTFKKDLLTQISEGTRENGVEMTVASEVAPELAFIMAMSAQKADMNGLNETKWLEWLEQFGPMDVVNATEQIFSVYFGDAETEVEAKKKQKEEPKES